MLVFGDPLRIERTMPVPRKRQIALTILGHYPLIDIHYLLWQVGKFHRKIEKAPNGPNLIINLN